MKTWNQLNKEDQNKAINIATNQILEAIVEGSIRFNDKLNNDTLQHDIDIAIEQANKMRTPWFAGEYVIEAVGETLKGMAQCDAKDSFYPDPTEAVIRL